MFALRRGAARSAERLPTSLNRSTRRYASEHHGADHGHSAGVNESLGTQFYFVITVIPLSIGVYALSRPAAEGEPNRITKLIDSYSVEPATWAAKNAVRTATLEQAAHDRNLYLNTPSNRYIELRFPEVFNTGSPYNVAAGQGPRNMDVLVQHYQKKNREAEQRQIEDAERRDAKANKS